MVNIIFKTVLKTVPQRRFIEMNNNIRSVRVFRDDRQEINFIVFCAEFRI